MVKMHKICSLLGIPIDQATPCNIYICNDIEIDCIAFETTEYLFVDFTTVDFSYVEMFQLPREYHVAGWRIQYLVSTQKIIIPIRIINDIYEYTPDSCIHISPTLCNTLRPDMRLTIEDARWYEIQLLRNKVEYERQRDIEIKKLSRYKRKRWLRRILRKLKRI